MNICKLDLTLVKHMSISKVQKSIVNTTINNETVFI